MFDPFFPFLLVIIIHFVVVHCEFVLKTRTTTRLHMNSKVDILQRKLLRLRNLLDMLRVNKMPLSHFGTFGCHGDGFVRIGSFYTSCEFTFNANQSRSDGDTMPVPKR